MDLSCQGGPQGRKELDMTEQISLSLTTVKIAQGRLFLRDYLAHINFQMVESSCFHSHARPLSCHYVAVPVKLARKISPARTEAISKCSRACNF